MLGATLALASGSASAHSVLTAPLPRDDSDSHKDPNGPCGVSRVESQPVTPLQPGAPAKPVGLLAGVAILLLRASLACHTGMATFSQAGVSGAGT